MTTHRWFLPETPDVLGMLRAQTAVTVEGMDALVAWSRSEAGAAERVRECEHRADQRKRELREALTVAFTTPLGPEDLFELSRGIDDLLNAVKDTVREAEVMGAAPDEPIGRMAENLAEGMRCVADALEALGRNDADATAAADAAVHTQRSAERVYRAAMSALIDVDDLRQVSARRELYRRLARAGDELVAVAERVWYSVLKDS